MPRFSATILATVDRGDELRLRGKVRLLGRDGLVARLDGSHQDAGLGLVDRGLPARHEERDADRQQRDDQDRPLAEPQDRERFLQVETTLLLGNCVGRSGRIRALAGLTRPLSPRLRASRLWFTFDGSCTSSTIPRALAPTRYPESHHHALRAEADRTSSVGQVIIARPNYEGCRPSGPRARRRPHDQGTIFSRATSPMRPNGPGWSLGR